MVGLQYILNYNSKKLQLKAIENTALKIEYGTNHSEEGKVSFLWSDDKLVAHSLADNSVLLELVFTKQGVLTNEDISITSDIATVEAWDANYQKHAIVKTTSKISGLPEIVTKDNWQVSPNPSNGIVKVYLALTGNKTVQFGLTTIDGKVLVQKKIDAAKGRSNSTLNLQPQAKLVQGIYYLKAVGEEGNNVRQVVIK